MARYNEILVGRFNRMMQKLFTMKGGPPCPQLAGDVQPSIAFFSGVENRVLEGWMLYGNGIGASAGGAGTFATVRLRNPTGSNVVAVIYKITIGPDVAAQASLQLQSGAVAADLTPFSSTNARFDARAQAGPTLILSSGTPAAPSFGLGRMVVGIPAGQFAHLLVDDGDEVPILPGDGIQVVNQTVNTPLGFTAFWWRERALEESERSFP